MARVPTHGHLGTRHRVADPDTGTLCRVRSSAPGTTRTQSAFLPSSVTARRLLDAGCAASCSGYRVSIIEANLHITLPGEELKFQSITDARDYFRRAIAYNMDIARVRQTFGLDANAATPTVLRTLAVGVTSGRWRAFRTVVPAAALAGSGTQTGGAPKPAQKQPQKPVVHYFQLQLATRPDQNPRPRWWADDIADSYGAERFEAQITNGQQKSELDADGSMRYDSIPGGTCRVKFVSFYDDIVKSLKPDQA
jgi:hypothetical protein